MQQRFWPVHAIDVGMALENMVHDDNTASQTFELYGPTNYSMAEIAEIVDQEIIKHRRHINLPAAVRKPLLKAMNKALWWPVGSEDQVEREFIDQVVDPSAKTFADLNIEPAELKSLTYQYLVSSEWVPKVLSKKLTITHQLPYRSSSFYDLPPSTEREKREERKFLHVIDNQ
jgi:NADH dehydrogenase (ubiquinone) 1 alpha subcomplex subunit 9